MGFLLVSTQVWAQRIPTIEIFHGNGCPHCAQELDWIESELKPMYPDLKVLEYEVWFHPENKTLWENRMKKFNLKPQAVPTNIVGNQVLVGFKKEALLAEMKKNFGEPKKIEKKVEVKTEKKSWWSGFLETILGWFGV